MHRQTNQKNSDRAVSETIGAVMLISVVVVAVAIIGVVLTSQGTPQNIPALDAVISNVDRTVFVYHDGGDTLESQNMDIMVNGERRDFAKNGDTGWTTWSTGETLAYTVPGTDPITTVRVVYDNSQTATTLSTANFGPSGMATTVPTGTPGPTHTITASAGPGGSISPSGSIVVNEGAGQTFTMNPDAGNYIVDVLVDGTSEGAITSYTFSNVLAGHTIAATFSSAPHTITATATAGGTITPSGLVSVAHGDTQTFTITADPGYHIVDVLIDGSSEGPVTSFTFTNVDDDHTIAASFAAEIYTITATSDDNGSITPYGVVTIAHGSAQTFAITPDPGYKILDVLVDGVSNGTISSYTFSNVQQDHTIEAAFTVNAYTITASAGANGGISPSGTVSVNHGASQAFNITPATMYHIQTLSVDGSTTTFPPVIPQTYTFTNVQANHTISATFAQNPRTQLFYDNFDASFSGWTASGATRRTDGIRNGTASVRLRGGSNNMYRTISTAGYSSIVVQFAWVADRLTSSGEYVRAEYSTNGGTTWNTLAQINGAVDQSSLTIVTSPTLPIAADNNGIFQLRFRVSASNTMDIMYVDDVKVTGIPHTL